MSQRIERSRVEPLEPRRLLSFALTPVFTGAVTDLKPLGGQLLIENADSVQGLSSIYINDGSATGNHRLAQISSYSDHQPTMIDYNGQVLFMMGDRSFAHPPLWLSNGTVDGTRPVGAQRFYYQDFLTSSVAKLGSFPAHREAIRFL